MWTRIGLRTSLCDKVAHVKGFCQVGEASNVCGRCLQGEAAFGDLVLSLASRAFTDDMLRPLSMRASSVRRLSRMPTLEAHEA